PRGSSRAPSIPLRCAQDDHALLSLLFPSSNTDPALALFEKRAERRQIVFSSLQPNRINIIPPERAGKFCVAPLDKIHKQRARFALSRVDLDLIPGLGVLQCDNANVRQRFFSFVIDVNGNKIMPLSAYRERSRKIGCLKIRYKEDDRAPCHDLVQIIKCQRRVCAARLRLEKQNLPNKSQRVGPALFRRNKKLYSISEKDQADLVIVPDRAEGEQTGNLCCQLAFGLCCAAKIP